MKLLTIAGLVASTFLTPTAHAAIGVTAAKVDASTSEYRRGEGRGRDGRGGGDRGGWRQQNAEPQTQQQAQPQSRDRWRGQSTSNAEPVPVQSDWRRDRRNDDGGRRSDWQRGGDRANRGGWEQPAPQPQTAPQPQSREDWRSNRRTYEGNSTSEWRRDSRRDDRRDERRYDDRRQDRGGWQSAPQPDTPPPQPQTDRGNRDGRDGAWRRERDNDVNVWRGRGRGDDRGRDTGWQNEGVDRSGRDRSGGGRNEGTRWEGRSEGRGDDRWDRDRRRYDRRDNDRYDRGGHHGGYDRHDNRRRDRSWDHGWRNDRRYDWRGHRDRYQDVYRRGRYYAPDRYHRYSRFNIGIYIGRSWYQDHYWISDPWSYRLPEVYEPYRWVRYYNDVLLIDTYDGRVVDVIYDFFW
jgi:Nickel/cobalt transporter regulator